MLIIVVMEEHMSSSKEEIKELVMKLIQDGHLRLVMSTSRPQYQQEPEVWVHANILLYGESITDETECVYQHNLN